MAKKIVLVLMAVVFLSSARLVFAGVIISEVKISPTEDRFIKLYNQDASAVDLTNWYIQRKTGTDFNSLVTKTNFENKKINGNSYFLISRSQVQDSSLVVGDLTLTESNVIQIKNAKGDVVDKVCWGDVNDCSTSIPNPTSGQNIKFTDHTSTTPSSTVGAGLSNISADSSSSSATTTSTKIKTIEVPKIKTQIIGKSLGFVGLPLALKAVAFGLVGEPLSFGKYFWNFGDGDSKEVQVAGSGQFTHTYFYPGEYMVTLDYYSTNYQETPDASVQATIKIVPVNISISKVGDEKDFFVELTNNTDYSADISNWFLVSDQKSFMIPRNTILPSKGKIMISPKITGFTIADQNTLKLMTPEREVVFEYAGFVMPTKITTPPSAPLLNQGGEEPSPPSQGGVPVSDEGGGNVALASAVSSDVISEKSVLPIIPIFSTVFIGAAAYGVYFVRRKKVVPVEGNEFEIMDE
jgi:hypothetical protein